MTGDADAGFDRRRHAFELLRGALDVDEADRPAWIARQAGGDAALAEAVQALLGASGAHVLDRGVDALAARLVGDAVVDDLPAGSNIGAWTVEALVGSGGMGAVYRVRREGDGYVQQGALKRIKRGMDSQAMLDRFRRERHILARLAHPAIARLLDGGVAADGRPYLVMEYIDGEPLPAWSARGDRGLDARVELVLALCAAVAHAHQRLVVHRDIKPANVIVAADGSPRLLDFGIARVLEADTGDDATATAARFVSRAYAAPEQLQGLAATTATDIFQLGALLHELLTGARLAGDDATTRPVRRLAAARERAGASGPAAITPKMLAGDAGIIVARATDADPARRYATVEAFADDLRRWRAGRPILARPDSSGYRLRRFVARHRWLVAVSMLAAIAVLGGAGIAIRQSRIAQGEAARAETVSRFLESIFSSIDPARARGRDVGAKELLDAGSTRIGSELSEHPAAQASLRSTLGSAYLSLGNFREAESQLRGALAWMRANEDPRTAQVLALLADVRRRSGDLDQALALVDEALARAEREPGGDDTGGDDTELLRVRAVILADRGERTQALALTGEIWRHRRARFGPAAAATLEAQADHADALYAVGRYDEALPLARGVLDGDRARLGNDHPRIGDDLQGLASILNALGRNDEALPLADEALALRRRILPPDHPELARSLGMRAVVLGDLGRAREALPLHVELVDILRRQPQPDELLLAAELNNWGYDCNRAGDSDEAARHFSEALAIWERRLAPDHEYALSGRANLASVWSGLGRLQDAEAQLRHVLAAREARRDAAGPDGVVATRALLADNLLLQDRPADALAMIEPAWSIARTRPVSDLNRQRLLALRAEAERRSGDAAAAARDAREALEALRALAPTGYEIAADAAATLARAIVRDDPATARAVAREAVVLLSAHAGDAHWRTARARGVLGLVLAGSDRDAARAELDAAIAALSAGRAWLPELAELRTQRAALGRASH
ncbi:serine/threonine-protein kinase [Dokdonella fugitiva]|uniref:Serine/threonine-protein kinase n=1 Tax=Dokdonella fugitiva TaxID=328517 RepID=A0A4R2I9M4_9GAMM|nr:serine/threonine-protein kinase [Dokdonella fugitiva]MBA8884449.1 serine/threonine-protein kinase [Dokdonella fugitiva]TCO40048.1 serine/threonine-protein kinase [Dokdonella fugitiva]